MAIETAKDRQTRESIEAITRQLDEQRRDAHAHMTHDAGTPLWEVEPDDLNIIGYDPHPAIKAEVAV